MPSVSTVGVVAASYMQLKPVMQVLLRSSKRSVVPLQRILVISDAMEIADDAIRVAAETALVQISQRTGIAPEPISFAQIVGDNIPLSNCNENALRGLQSLEFQNTIGIWIESNAPEVGDKFSKACENVRNLDRISAIGCLDQCERLFESIQAFLAPGIVICFPTTLVIAPVKNTLNPMESVSDFYERTMAITAFSSVGRLPEISAPVLTVDKCPVGLSFAAGHYQDEFLLSAVEQLLS